MTRYRLKDNHPAIEALNKLWTKADELKISIEVLGFRTIVTIDGKDYFLQDIENGRQPMSDFPPACEFKLTYEEDEE